MIIKPKVKGFICVNAHPIGCQKSVEDQVDYASGQTLDGPKKALIIGCSSGYGLASRIALGFGSNADTIGVYFDREPKERKTASAGWYKNQHFETLAKKKGLEAQSLNVDAFQQDAKSAVIELIRNTVKDIDLVIYSVAAPRRYVESEDKLYSSVLKPVGESFSGKTINTDKGVISSVELEPATQSEIDSTVKVMGGEDWHQWMDTLNTEGVLSQNCKTIAYTYIGEELTQQIYGEGTIGHAKKDLDRVVLKIDELLNKSSDERSPNDSNHPANEKRAYIGVLKAIVTQSSAAIPVMPLYISLLYKVMKEKGVHEGCIEQISRLLKTGLYSDSCQIDDAGRLRVDEHEIEQEVQLEVKHRWNEITNKNLRTLSDFDGYKDDFLQLFGFGYQDINYEAEVASFFKGTKQSLPLEHI